MLAGVEPASARNLEGALRASRLFGRLDGALVGELARSAVRRSFDRRAVLWRAGDRATSFTIIVHGLVEILRPGREGGGTILAIFGPRESIGDMAALEMGSYPADAIALTNVEMLALPAPTVIEAMRGHPEVADSVNRSLVEHTRALQEKIKIVTAGPVAQRLATLLLHLVGRFGDELDDGSLIVPVALSRSELARVVDATVETTIRAMSRWNKQGIVGTVPEGFVVRDIEALRKLAAAAPAP
jgi:CRP-like cAMP-binding protein